jgi:hypothetical protein
MNPNIVIALIIVAVIIAAFLLAYINSRGPTT